MHSPSRRKLSSVLSALALLAVLGPAVSHAEGWEFGSKTVAGSGHASSVKRELAAFHEIAVSLAGKVELVQGNNEGIAIEADDNLLPLIETVVKNGELIIRPVKGINLSGNPSIKITVYARNIDNLSLSGSANLTAARLVSPKLAGSIAGSGRITIKDLQSDALSISIAGSGRFEAQGTAKAMDVNIAGSGDVNVSKLSAQDVKVSIAGSGDAALWVRKSLTVSIAGSGDVRYYGEGTLRDSSIMGSGHVKQIGSTPPV
nr:head GIN domain-containing protein [Rhodoferax sp.]